MKLTKEEKFILYVIVGDHRIKTQDLWLCLKNKGDKDKREKAGDYVAIVELLHRKLMKELNF